MLRVALSLLGLVASSAVSCRQEVKKAMSTSAPPAVGSESEPATGTETAADPAVQAGSIDIAGDTVADLAISEAFGFDVSSSIKGEGEEVPVSNGQIVLGLQGDRLLSTEACVIR